MELTQPVPGEAQIDALGLLTIELNARVREAVTTGARRITLQHVCGQRYIGTGLCLEKPVQIDVYGIPGNDLGMFIDGHRIFVHGNAQDGVGNTMNSGEIVVCGRAGDVLGMSMRGGEIFVRDSVGYRVGIHMKEYGEKRPVIVIGGAAQDFLGEYLAGGIIILLGLNQAGCGVHQMNFIGAGMHGGVIYVRGEVRSGQLGDHVRTADLEASDYHLLDRYIHKYATYFGVPEAQIAKKDFKKILPITRRPYAGFYTHEA